MPHNSDHIDCQDLKLYGDEPKRDNHGRYPHDPFRHDNGRTFRCDHFRDAIVGGALQFPQHGQEYGYVHRREDEFVPKGPLQDAGERSSGNRSVDELVPVVEDGGQKHDVQKGEPRDSRQIQLEGFCIVGVGVGVGFAG